jgi:putative peptide zinc metalloprotease protein
MTGIALPRLREDLQLHETGLDADGQAGFVIEDALRNRYFRLPAEALRLLECWATGTVDQVSARAGVHPSEVEALAQFLDRNRLLAKPLRGWADLAAEREQVDHSMFKKLLHGYLSFRVPLFDPTRLLDAVLPLARVLASRVVVTFILLLGITGLYFVARQWDNFAQTFLDFFSPQGLVLYGLTLGGLKVFHEMGHGLTARHFGCRVPVMGIGFDADAIHRSE